MKNITDLSGPTVLEYTLIASLISLAVGSILPFIGDGFFAVF